MIDRQYIKKSPVANSGELHYSCCLEASVMCTVTGTEESTWGAIKEMYR